MSAAAVAIPAYAKLNLELRVLGGLPDGRHAIATRFQAISPHDLLIAERAAATSLEGGLPDDLVLRAQAALEREVGRPLPARWRLVKRLPVGAGLGGGSSDAAAALRALTALFGLPGPEPARAAARQVGADVPFFLLGGAADAAGAGERLRPAPAAGGWFALAWPGFAVATGAVYEAWDRLGGEGPNHLRRAAEAVEPRLAAFAERLGEGWLMTGSGSAFFRPCATRAEASERTAALDCPWTAVAAPVPAWARPSEASPAGGGRS